MLHDYDAVLDTVGGETYRKSFKVLKEGSGIIVSKLEQPDQELMKTFGVRALFEPTQISTNRLRELTQWVNDNHIRVNVDKTFELKETAKALEYQKDAHPRGKVVISMQQ